MSTLDKIVYVADYIEHNRNFPLVEEARQVAEQSLIRPLLLETVHTVEHWLTKLYRFSHKPWKPIMLLALPKRFK